jgi:hypothetical protein
VDIDFDNKAYFVIFTVLGYPPGMDEQLNELPDAIRPLPEVFLLQCLCTDRLVPNCNLTYCLSLPWVTLFEQYDILKKLDKILFLEVLRTIIL